MADCRGKKFFFFDWCRGKKLITSDFSAHFTIWDLGIHPTWAVVTTQVPFVLKTNPLLSPNSWRQFQLQSTVHFPLSSEIASSQNFSNQGRFKIGEWDSSKTWTHAHTGARELEEARTLLRLSCLRTLPRTVLVFCFVLRHLCTEDILFSVRLALLISERFWRDPTLPRKHESFVQRRTKTDCRIRKGKRRRAILHGSQLISLELIISA